MARMVTINDVIAFCGKVNVEIKGENKLITIINPVKYSKDIKSVCKIQPIYKKIYGMADDYFLGLLNTTLALITKGDYLDTDTLRKFDLMTRNEAIEEIHHPQSFEGINKANERILFDDLFLYNYLLKQKLSDEPKSTNKAIRFSNLSTVNKYIHSLPFELTEGQKEAIRVLLKTSREGKIINALIQGDVGCGKTVVAAISLLMGFDAGHQSVLIAPTQVLAEQHALDFKNAFEKIGVPVHYIYGGMKAKEKKSIIKELESGNPCVIIGTHAVFSKDYVYPNLGIVVIDEEHKFGVDQREILQNRANHIHRISMSATPIPRTLAMSMYGENVLVCTIKTLPKGKKPIITESVLSDGEAILKINAELKKKHQAYVICPFIEDNDNEMFADVDSVESVYDQLNNYYSKYNITVGMINGRLKKEVVTSILEKFYSGEIQILVSTTMVEVGVNVPNATAILIKNAERFGLAQLHQLRGRVGRGIDQGYCILQSSSQSGDAKTKIETMCSTTDGFVVAQKDLEMRGMGDFLGTAQSGDNQLICLMMANADLNNQIREEIASIYDNPARKNLFDEKIEQFRNYIQEKPKK